MQQDLLHLIYYYFRPYLTGLVVLWRWQQWTMAHHQRHSAKYFSSLTFGNRMFSLFLLDPGFPGERFGIPARAFSCIIAEASDRETSVSNGHLPLCLVFLPCSQHHTFSRRWTAVHKRSSGLGERPPMFLW